MLSEFWQKQWDDIRPNLKWAILSALVLSISGSGFFSWLQAKTGNPVTVAGALWIFSAIFIVLLVGVGIFLTRKRIGTPIGLALLALITLGLIGWNIWLQQHVTHLESQMERYVIPRHLTQKQKESIAEYLKTSGIEPQAVVMKITPRNEEAGSYRADLQQALEKAGWPVAKFIYDETIQEGLGIHTLEPYPNPEPPTIFDRVKGKKTPTQILTDAFKNAGVIMHHGGGGSSREISAPVITIEIGSRRRDKWAIPQPRNFDLEVYMNTTDDPDK